MEYEKVVGRVYDVDYLAELDFTQVLVQGKESSVFVTREIGVQTVAESSLAASCPVTVEYKEIEGSKRIRSIKTSIDPGDPQRMPGRVLELGFIAKDRCLAKIATADGEVKVFTRDSRAQSILEAAFALSVPVQELAFEANEAQGNEITRVKINLPVHSVPIRLAAPIRLCASFGLFPDNTPLPQNFSLGGFAFSAPPGVTMFVNETSGESGLQFSLGGIAVTVPAPVNKLELRVGAFAGPFEIQAKDKAGTVVAIVTVNKLNQFSDVVISGPGITTLHFAGGGNEAILVSICTQILSC